MLGNGFDLNCGLKTRFTDVYKEYCVPKESDSNLIKSFKEMIKKDYETWGDFEVAMNNKLPKFDSEEDFLNCFNDFKAVLSDYLEEQDNQINQKLNYYTIKQAVQEEFSASMLDFYQKLTPNEKYKIGIKGQEKIEYNIITFNYTSFVDNIINSIYKNEIFINQVLHIHGKLEDGDLALGMDNSQQVLENHYLLSDNGMLTFIKQFFLKEYDISRLTQALNIIENSDVICTFGLSFGESDLTWRNAIIEWLEKATNHCLVYFDYKNINNREIRFVNDKILLENEERKQLIQKWDFDIINEEDELTDQIFFPIGYSIFNIGKTIAEAEETIKKQESQRRLIEQGID